MRPSTLQYAGIAGVMRDAGLGPRSATASADAGTSAAESIVAAPLGRPMAAAATGAVSAAQAWAGSAPRPRRVGPVGAVPHAASKAAVASMAPPLNTVWGIAICLSPGCFV
ncbi:hypothetical protein D9M68_747680 [compost metagenome]